MTGRLLCAEMEVSGAQTLKYGDPNYLEDYQGGLNPNDLSLFFKLLEKEGKLKAVMKKVEYKIEAAREEYETMVRSREIFKKIFVDVSLQVAPIP